MNVIKKCTKSKKMIIEYVPLTYIFSVSLKFGACYITGQWGQFRVNNATSYFRIFFGIFVVVFHQKVCAFIIFISFFDEIANFCYRILTKQKPE